ncbi:MAG: TonB-dependent receptor, partial [Pedobacter sp.]
DQQKFLVALGYDHNKNTLAGNGFKRITGRLNNTYKLLKNKVEITAGINFMSGTTDANYSINDISLNNIGLYPYASLADQNGNPLPVAKFHRLSYLDGLEVSNPDLLSWKYYPLNELNNTTNTNKKVQYDLQLSARYKVITALNAELLYQYSKGTGDQTNLKSINSYYARDQINRFTAVNTDGSLIRPVPLGGIRDLNLSNYFNHNLRGQLNFNKQITEQHDISAIAGYEIRHSNSISNQARQYGYDDDHATASIVDYMGNYKLFITPSTSNQISNHDGISDETDRFISWYANTGYRYKERYLFSASARLDRSNIFGVNTNQKGVPLWSAGIGWELSNEAFYRSALLPYIKFRLTYGYNGNVDNSLSAFTTALYNNGSGNQNNKGTRLPYATIINPPNPELRWERVRIINAGVDFGLKSNRLSGGLEVYRKKGIDLIGTSPISPTTGISVFTGNTAFTTGNGIDINLNSINIKGVWGWETRYLFSYVSDRIDKYLTKSANNVVNDYVLNRLPLEGKPQFAIYSFQSAGLDPQTGESRGYVNGEISKDYAEIVNNGTLSDINYHGSRRPVIFGALRNTLRWKQLSASFNVSYRAGYYFRKT